MSTPFEELYQRTDAILRELNSEPDPDRLALLVSRRGDLLPQIQQALEAGELPTEQWLEAWTELESRVRSAMKRELDVTADALRHRQRIRVSTTTYTNGYSRPRFVDSAV
jgi:hypothetical protein